MENIMENYNKNLKYDLFYKLYSRIKYSYTLKKYKIIKE